MLRRSRARRSTTRSFRALGSILPSFRARRSSERSSRARRLMLRRSRARRRPRAASGCVAKHCAVSGHIARRHGSLARATGKFRSERFLAPPGSLDWSPKVSGLAWTDTAYAALRRSIERAVPEGHNRNNVLERMAILDCARQKLGDTALASCDPAADPPDSVKEWKKMIEAASVDQGAYAKALAAILGGLVCSNAPDRIYVLRGCCGSIASVKPAPKCPRWRSASPAQDVPSRRR